MPVMTETGSVVSPRKENIPLDAASLDIASFGNVSSRNGIDETIPEDLIRRISRLIKRETSLGVQEMKVVFENGRLILSGYCRTFYTKQLAQQAVMTVVGDVELINNIRVV